MTATSWAGPQGTGDDPIAECTGRKAKSKHCRLIVKTALMLNSLWDRDLETFTGSFAPGYTHVTNGRPQVDGFFTFVTEGIYTLLTLDDLDITHIINTKNKVAFTWTGTTRLPMGPGDTEEVHEWYEQWWVEWNDDETQIVHLEELENAEDRGRRIIGLALGEAAACDLCDGTGIQLEGCEEAFTVGFCQ